MIRSVLSNCALVFLPLLHTLLPRAHWGSSLAQSLWARGWVPRQSWQSPGVQKHIPAQPSSTAPCSPCAHVHSTSPCPAGVKKLDRTLHFQEWGSSCTGPQIQSVEGESLLAPFIHITIQTLCLLHNFSTFFSKPFWEFFHPFLAAYLL